MLSTQYRALKLIRSREQATDKVTMYGKANSHYCVGIRFLYTSVGSSVWMEEGEKWMGERLVEHCVDESTSWACMCEYPQQY